MKIYIFTDNNNIRVYSSFGKALAANPDECTSDGFIGYWEFNETMTEAWSQGSERIIELDVIE